MAKTQIFDEAINSETVMRGKVVRLGKRGDDAYMEVEIPKDNSTGIIFESEADGEVERKSLMPFLGEEIPYIITGMDEESGKPVCSRKKAQDKLRIAMVQDFVGRKVMEGTVVHTEPYGVYIDVNGVSGILKNTDYIGVSFPVRNYLKVGDKIKVVCKSISQNSKIQWEPAEKPEFTPIEYDIEVDTVVIGVVTNLQPWEKGGVGVFVNIAEGLDALCLLPPDKEIHAGNKVAIKIVTVEKAAKANFPPRVRGKIVRVTE